MSGDKIIRGLEEAIEYNDVKAIEKVIKAAVEEERAKAATYAAKMPFTRTERFNTLNVKGNAFRDGYMKACQEISGGIRRGEHLK